LELLPQRRAEKTGGKVRRIIIVLALIMINLQISYSDVKVNKGNEKDINSIIKTIRKHYNDINSKFSTYDKKTVKLFDESTDGAKITGYYEKGELKKTIGWYYSEMWKSFEECYYVDNKVIFLYSKSVAYERSIYVEPVKVIATEENRWYFNNEQLIKWISGSQIIPVNSEKFKNSNNYFREYFEKYKNIFIKGDISQYDAMWEDQEEEIINSK
jgi:hypothetical protein